MAKDSFQINVLNVVEPGQWTGSQIVDVLGGEAMCVFWKPAVAAPSTISAVTDNGGYSQGHAVPGQARGATSPARAGSGSTPSTSRPGHRPRAATRGLEARPCATC